MNNTMYVLLVILVVSKLNIRHRKSPRLSEYSFINYLELYLFSSVGKTKYFCIKQQNIWQIKKTAIYYNVPYNLDNKSTSKTEYFQYNGELFLYNLENNKFEKSELNHLSAVVDVKNIDILIDLLSRYL